MIGRAITWGLESIQCRPVVTLMLCLLAGALVSVALGQDSNWDLLNYHLYNPWAFLHGRLGHDIAVAGSQSYYNPLLDLPYYLMISGPLGQWPRVVAAIQGLWYGGLIFAVWWIVVAYARVQQRRPDIGDLAAIVIGISGSAVIAQAGTTFNEVPLAVLVLAAFGLVLNAMHGAADGGQIRHRGIVIAGFLVGMACGLKPTAVIYVPALALACLAVRSRRRWILAMAFLVAAGVAVLITYGWWGLRVYQVTGNPVFPLFNNVFHSDWTRAINGTDPHFRPHGLVQWLFYPFYWAARNVALVTESRMIDARFAGAYLALVGMGLAYLFRKPGATQASVVGVGERSAQGMLIVFVVTAYAFWLALFSIYRYAIPIEALSGLVVMVALRKLWNAASTPVMRRTAVVFSTLVALTLIFGTHRPDWGHVDYAARSVDVQAPHLPNHSLVFIAGMPDAYVVPFLQGTPLQFVGLTWFTAASRKYRLGDQVRERIRQHHGPMYAVLRKESKDARKWLRLFSLKADPGTCRAIRSNIDHGLAVCRVTQG